MRSITQWSGAIALLTIGVATSAVRGQCDPVWSTGVGNPGAASTVYALLAVDEPSAIGPAIYMGMQGASSGTGVRSNVARWDGTSWSLLGTQTTNTGVVYGLTAHNGVLYVAGSFTSMGGQASTRGIAQWNGSDWTPVGTGNPSGNALRALAFLGSDLYVGGLQNDMGGVTARKIARWNGTSYSALPGQPLATNDQVLALATYNDGGGDAVYVGGIFTTAGGNSNARNIFRFDGTTLTAVGRGTNDDVESMTVFNGSLYIGGQFTRVYQTDGTELIANKIARWDGTQWYALGSGTDTPTSSHVLALAGHDGLLYAGGNYQNIGGQNVRFLAKWNGAAWSAVGASDFNGGVNALTSSSYDGGLYAGGLFTTAGTPSATRVIRWAGPLPQSPHDAAAVPAAITVGESSMLTASSPGATIDWYTGGCGDTLVGSGAMLEVFPAETTTYYAQASNGTCASYACDSVTVTVECTPDAPQDAAADPEQVAVGESSTLSASVPGATIHWYTDTCGGTLIGTGGVISVAPLETTTYYARAWNGFCYSAACDTVTVTVDCTPDAPQDAAASPPEILVGESSTLSASAAGAAIYWYTGGCGDTLVGTGGELSVAPTDTTTYYARAWNGFCFSETCDSVTVVVNCISLEITQQPEGGALCTPDVPTHQMCVLAEGTGTLHYQWRRNGLTLIGAVASCYTAAQPGTFTCVVTDDCTPVLSAEAKVVIASPQAGDFDGDGDADATDLAQLTSCLQGPAVGADCPCLDIVADGYIDLVDFAVFQMLAAD